MSRRQLAILIVFPWAVCLSAALSPARAAPAESLEQLRQQMVESQVCAGGVKNPRVLESMLRTPRHEFVPPRLRGQAYDDAALPIGEKQTISAPFIVAFMTEVVDPQPTDKVLEIGTGSGYQAAVLSPLVKEVYTVEIVEALAQRARDTLHRLHYHNVFTKTGDGYQGWLEHAPFDKIIVTCSPEKAPQPLIDQLKEGGAMVVPVGQSYQQMLYVLRKTQRRLVRRVAAANPVRAHDRPSGPGPPGPLRGGGSDDPEWRVRSTGWRDGFSTELVSSAATDPGERRPGAGRGAFHYLSQRSPRTLGAPLAGLCHGRPTVRRPRLDVLGRV